jgi:hypothetical protein
MTKQSQWDLFARTFGHYLQDLQKVSGPRLPTSSLSLCAARVWQQRDSELLGWRFPASRWPQGSRLPPWKPWLQGNRSGRGTSVDDPQPVRCRQGTKPHGRTEGGRWKQPTEREFSERAGVESMGWTRGMGE